MAELIQLFRVNSANGWGGPSVGLRVSDRIRTGDRLDHNQELYQLSYAHRATLNVAPGCGAVAAACETVAPGGRLAEPGRGRSRFRGHGAPPAGLEPAA